LRLVARFAAASAVAFEGTPLPRATVTGSPIRPELLAATADATAARTELGLPVDRVLVGVMTGSLGSTRVNMAVADLADRWRDRRDVAIRHAVGRRDWPSFPPPPTGELVYQPV